ncbi:MAG TPA: FAD-dependent oxidoreductase [Bacillales bacterium]|nr:FAD-dependent oxidoreductase [Bacillales bacterium]
MKKLLLAGAGRAHLYLLNELRQNRLPDVSVTLLTLSKYKYSREMFAGFAEGIYDLNDIRMDVGRLFELAGAEWIEGAAVSIDPEQKVVLTDQGKIIDYDVVSFDIGTLTEETNKPGVLEYAETLRPHQKLPDVMERILHSDRLVLAGRGAVCTEMALSLQARRHREGRTPVVWIGSAFDSTSRKAKHIAMKKIRASGIAFHEGVEVKEAQKEKIVTADNQPFLYDSLLWMQPPRPHQMFAASLPVDRDGYLLVEETLQVKQHPSIFGAGNCVSISGYGHIDHEGRYSMGQPQILWENIKGFLGDGEGALYRPSETLSLFSTGNQSAVALYKDKAFGGKWVWSYKNRLDRRFIKKASP